MMAVAIAAIPDAVASAASPPSRSAIFCSNASVRPRLARGELPADRGHVRWSPALLLRSRGPQEVSPRCPEAVAVPIGAHVSIRGRIYDAVPRAQALGCECLQIFVGSPRQWR